jgi:hypothetical protein
LKKEISVVFETDEQTEKDKKAKGYIPSKVSEIRKMSVCCVEQQH